MAKDSYSVSKIIKPRPRIVEVIVKSRSTLEDNFLPTSPFPSTTDFKVNIKGNLIV